jgi:ribulose-phosphate 3-epimerase
VPWREWIRTIEVEPSIYGADFARLGDQLEALLRTECRVFHFDVGDGHFVPPITMGPIVLKSIAEHIHRFEGVIDVHLMTETPHKHFQEFAEAGADSVTFHLEAVEDPSATAAAAREHGLQVGIAVRPDTPIEDLAAVAEHADIVLCMSVTPGWSGQEYLEGSSGRVATLKGLVGDKPVQVDGGVTNENVREIFDAGATLIVAGSAIFAREDLPRAYRRLVQALA